MLLTSSSWSSVPSRTLVVGSVRVSSVMVSSVKGVGGMTEVNSQLIENDSLEAVAKHDQTTTKKPNSDRSFGTARLSKADKFTNAVDAL